MAANDIETLLSNILQAIFGKDVRQSIHDAIRQCYYDGKAGGNDLEARERAAAAEARMDSFTALSNGSTTGDAELQDIRIGFDGVVYGSAGTAVREQIRNSRVIEVGPTEPTKENVVMWIDDSRGLDPSAAVKIRNSDGAFVDIPALKGESIYEIAVRNGYSGTEAEYLTELLGDGWVNAFSELSTEVQNLADTVDAVSNCPNDIIDLSNRINTNSTNIATNSDDIESINDDISTINTNITSITSDVNSLKSLKDANNILKVAYGGTGQNNLAPAVTTAGVRAIYAGTTAMTPGTTNLTTGQIYLQYE